MFIHEIDINILNYGVLFLVGYQDKYKNWDLYQYMNDFLALELETAVHVTHEIINI